MGVYLVWRSILCPLNSQSQLPPDITLASFQAKQVREHAINIQAMSRDHAQSITEISLSTARLKCKSQTILGVISLDKHR